MSNLPTKADGPSAATEAGGRAGEADTALIPVPVVPGYDILGELGRGGMGVVFQARQVSLNRLVALKVVRPDAAAGPTELARFLLEAEAVASIDHPAVVKIHDYGEYGDRDRRPYFAMELLTGGSLAERLKAGPALAPREAAALVEKIARGVQAAHDQGIVHRDLKPHNVLLDATGRPKVTDFGVAKRGTSDLTQTGAVMGTPAYMAPEQAGGRTKFVGPAADVYALGVILYQCLAGTVPFTGADAWSVMRKVADDAPAAPRELNAAVDPDLELVCLKCLEKHPDERYLSAGHLAADLDRYLHGEPVSVQPPGFWDWVRQLWRVRPEYQRYTWPVVAWIGLIILIAHTAIFTLASAGSSVVWVWCALAFCTLAEGAVAWWYELRRFRRALPIERQATGAIVGHLLARTGLLVLIPLAPEVRASAAFGYYPPLTAISGLALFILGTIHWGRFVLIGLAVLALVPVMHRFPAASPLLYGLVMAGIMWYWAYSVGITFARAPVHESAPNRLTRAGDERSAPAK
jgi:serine/threonine-protein kinase